MCHVASAWIFPHTNRMLALGSLWFYSIRPGPTTDGSDRVIRGAYIGMRYQQCRCLKRFLASRFGTPTFRARCTTHIRASSNASGSFYDDVGFMFVYSFSAPKVQPAS